MRFTSFGRAATAIAFALAAVSAVQAQDYPAKPIRIIAPFPPGSGPDVNAREMGAKLAPLLGQPVVVENRPGASGIIGTEAAIKSAPDGYTLYIGSTSTMSILPYVFTKLAFNVERDLVPISLLGVLQTGLIANAAVPASNAKELIAIAKAKPDTINVANQGIGSYSHLSSEWFIFAAGTKMKLIPYATTSVYGDLVGGQIQLMFDGLPAAVGNIKSGKLKLLAITGKARHPTFPDVPTFAEAGLTDYEPLAWQGLFAPAGTPKAVIDKVGAAMAQVGKAADLAEKWRSYGGELSGNSPAEFAAFLKADQARWSAVIKRANVKLD
jgi:tripartite-type tricarboxylate transporter receptor subunit TctC